LGKAYTYLSNVSSRAHARPRAQAVFCYKPNRSRPRGRQGTRGVLRCSSHVLFWETLEEKDRALCWSGSGWSTDRPDVWEHFLSADQGRLVQQEKEVLINKFCVRGPQLSPFQFCPSEKAGGFHPVAFW